MKKRLLTLLVMLQICFAIIAQSVQPDIVRVKLTREAADRIASTVGADGVVQASSLTPFSTGVTTFDAVCRSLNAVEMKRVFRYNKKFEKRHRKAGLDLWYEIKVGNGVQPYAAVKSLDMLSEVTHAETVMIPDLYADDMPVNDPYLPRQWHYKNTGQSRGTAGADINLFEAWKKTTGSKDVIVAIIDGGMLLEHPDLAGNLWINKAEYNGERGKDNDGNSYINDIYGWNFVDNTPFISGHFHGTHVAGTVAAENNNGKGVAGIAGGTGKGDGVRLMSCQIFTGKFQTSASATNFAEPFIYAADNGAVIAQCSWGWNQPGYVEKSVLEAIDYFVENAGKDEDGNPLPNTKMAGGIVFFASGNSGLEGLYYPGCYKNVIAVAATDHDNKMTSYSNHGTWVDIMAPGGYISRGTDTEGIWSTSVTGGYEAMEGTSMACPHISGVAALVLSSVGNQHYTPELLWTRMKNACISLDDLNPGYVGHMGAGIINAAKAVQVDDGIAPDAVTDLAAGIVAQDFLEVTFTAPADKDNGSAARYDLRYSLSPITNTNFDGLEGIVVDARTAGSTENLRLEGLTPETMYYIALKSRDIWGNSSDLSNILQATTSSFPKVSVSAPSDTLLFAIPDVKTNPVATQNIEVKNIGQGRLNYSLLYTGITDPRTVPDDFTLLHELGNYNANAPGLDIGAFGDDGKSNRFTAASKFIVDTDNFYFTHLKAAIQTRTADRGTPSEDFLLRIYKGGAEPQKGTLIYDNRIPFRQSGGAIDQVFDLGEGIDLDKGDVIWIVFEFPAEYYMPMGINYSLKNNLTGFYFFSEDVGKTWTDINTAEGLGISRNIAYRVFPQSIKESLPDHITFNPETGEALENVTGSSTVTVDATNLENGVYTSYVKVFTNDPTQPLVALPAKIIVEGHPAQMETVNNIDFQTVVIGSSGSYDLKIVNKGLGSLAIDSLFVTDDVHFNVTPAKLLIKPNETAFARITFTPDNTGLLIKSLKLQMPSSTQTIVLNGNGVLPPVASVNPTEIDVTLPAGGTAESSFKIKNTGVYQLEYKIPAFEGITTFSVSDDHTGYVATTSRESGGPAFKWEDMADAQDITQLVISSGDRATKVDLGFSVDYYGQTFDTLSILQSGMFSMGTLSRKINVSVSGFPKPGGPGNTFSPLYLHGKNILLSQGKVLYKKAPGYAVIEYRHVCNPASKKGRFEIPPSGTIDVQTVIYNNGVIEYYYKNLEEGPKIQVKLFSVAEAGLENIDSSDGATITSADPSFMLPGEQLAVRITPPVPSFVKALTPSKGLVTPGEEMEIKLNLLADKTVLDSVYYNHIFVTTNDPNNSTIDIPLKVTVTGESKPVTLVKNINYGEVPMGVSKAVNISVNNAGGKSFEVTSATNSNPVFETQAPVGTTVKGFSSLVYSVVFTPDAVGDFADEVVISTDIAGAEPIRVSLTGKGVAASNLVLDALDQSYEMSSGEVIDTAVIVRNEGDGKLEYILSTSEWIKPQESAITARAHFDQSGYYWDDSKTNTGVTYEWVTIENAKKLSLMGIVSATTYSLPFEFPYYGKNYNQVLVSAHGRLSFNLNESERQRVSGPFLLPDHDRMNNMIVGLSPVSGFYPGGSSDRSTSQVYVENFDDKVVFTWYKMLSGTFSFSKEGSSATFQIILYKDGAVKIQYHDFKDANWAKNESIIGIENEDGTDGIAIGYMDGYPQNAMAVMITPGLKRTLAPHQSERIPLKIDPSKVMDGNHIGKIIVSATDLTRKMDSVSVNLNFHGAGKLVLSTDSVGFGDTYSYKINNSAYNKYERYINIKNIGSKAAQITSIALPPYVTLANITSGSIAPFETVEGTLRFTPTADGVYDDKIVFTYGGELSGQTGEVKITANLMYPPVEELTSGVVNNDYVVTLLENEKDTTGFVLKNAGLSDMNYQLNVEVLTKDEYGIATGKLLGDEVRQTAVVSTPFDMEKIKAFSFESSGNVILPSTRTHTVRATYVDSIVYNNFFPQKGFEWATKETPFVYANRYDVNNVGGFNLTHIANQIRNYNDNVEVTIEVLYGKDYLTAEVLQTTKAIINRNDNGEPLTDVGQFEFFELDEPVNFMQGETFWIRFSQQSGVGFNQMMFYHGDASLTDHFLLIEGSTLYKWYTITEGMAPMMACYSERKSGEESWITAEQSAGILTAGQEANVEVKLNPLKLRSSERVGYARISVTSNDPVERTNEFFVAMTVNQAPQISSAQTEYDVNEGEQLVVDLAIVDNDGDTFTYEVNDKVATGQPTATLHTSGYGFTINPDYGTAGTWSYVVSATDVHNQKSEYPVTVNVKKVNRAPVSLGIKDTTVYVERAPIAINLAAVFNDPDGDALTYTVESYDALFVAAQTVSSTLRVTGWAEGSSTVTVRATDTDGLYVDETFNVTVLSGTGIGGNDYNGSVSVYPNPVKNELNIELGENWSGKVTIDIIDLAGKVAISEIRTVENVNRINMSSLPSGVYQLRITSADKKQIVKIIKE